MMTPQEGQDLIRRMFAAFTDFDTPVDRVAAFIAPDYRQCVDGKELDRAGFLDHVRALRAALLRLDIVIERIVSDGVSAATVHVANAVKASGGEARVKVVAFYEFRDGRIGVIDELTHVCHGESEDRQLGAILPG